jgi:hypothetical protein
VKKRKKGLFEGDESAGQVQVQGQVQIHVAQLPRLNLYSRAHECERTWMRACMYTSSGVHVTACIVHSKRTFSRQYRLHRGSDQTADEPTFLSRFATSRPSPSPRRLVCGAIGASRNRSDRKPVRHGRPRIPRLWTVITSPGGK